LLVTGIVNLLADRHEDGFSIKLQPRKLLGLKLLVMPTVHESKDALNVFTDVVTIK
jgi:hypothetical protein